MKLIVAIVQDRDVSKLMDEMTKNNFRLTKLASTGGFLRKGNTTLLIGVEEEKVIGALSIIKRVCKTREATTSLSSIGLLDHKDIPSPFEIKVGGATVFILDVDRFESI